VFFSQRGRLCAKPRGWERWETGGGFWTCAVQYLRQVDDHLIRRDEGKSAICQQFNGSQTWSNCIRAACCGEGRQCRQCTVFLAINRRLKALRNGDVTAREWVQLSVENQDCSLQNQGPKLYIWNKHKSSTQHLAVFFTAFVSQLTLYRVLDAHAAFVVLGRKELRVVGQS